MGDKTTLKLNSSFNRINVRNTFIVIEYDISQTAKFFLFENNDTESQRKFENAVVPYLDKKITEGRIEDGRWVSDGRVNDAQAKVENTMVGVAMLKPKYSINYIKLNFYNLRPDISFEEIDI